MENSVKEDKTRKNVTITKETDTWLRLEAAKLNISQGEVIDKIVKEKMS